MRCAVCDVSSGIFRKLIAKIVTCEMNMLRGNLFSNMSVVHIISFIWLSLSFVFLYVLYSSSSALPKTYCSRTMYRTSEDFENFDNVSGTTDGCYIVPNYVHFIRFRQPEFSFVDVVCVLSALKHQKPEKIFFHTDSTFQGKYWEVLLGEPGFREVLEIKIRTVPTAVYGQKLSRGWLYYHAGDIARLEVLMEYGGIYLDNDSYIVKSLDEFRRFEMTLGWCEEKGCNLYNQVIVAHSKARFLREWLETYKGAYKQNLWYYNAGVRPTEEVLNKRPELVHRMTRYFAQSHSVPYMLFLARNGKWRDHYAIHLLINHQYLLKSSVSANATYPVIFTEDNIKNYPVNFYDMAKEVYPFK